MFKGKYLVIALLLSIALPSWGEALTADHDVEKSNMTRRLDSMTNKNGSVSLSAAKTGTSAVFSLLELASHAVIQLGSGNQEYFKVISNHLNKIPKKVYDFSAANSYANRFAHSLLLNHALSYIPVANDYACGMMTLTTENGFFIESVEVKHGSIQNDSQFNLIADNIYTPKRPRNVNLLLIKQITGWTKASNAYITELPIDFYVTVSNGEKTSTLNIQKKTCTMYSYGKAQASVISGDHVPYDLVNVETDKNAPNLGFFSSAYGKPALVRILGDEFFEM